MTKLFKNSKSVLSCVLALAVLAVSLFTGVVINSEAASCVDDLSQLNVVYADGGISQTAPTKGSGTEGDPYIIENASHLRYLAQCSTPATTYGKYYKVDDNVDVLVLQSKGYIDGVAGSLEAFLALDANGVKTALSKESVTVGETTYNRIIFQSGTLASNYDGFAGTIDFNGVTICGMFNQNGGLIAIANGGTTLKNLTLCNNYITSGWYNGNLVGMLHNGTAASSVTNEDGTTTNVYKPLTISNVVIHDCYQYTTGNGYSNTGVLAGTLMNSKNIPIHVSNILTYDNVSLGTVSSSDTTEKNCALYGALPTSWSGAADGVANASYSNIVTLDCVPYPTQTINNQCTRATFFSNVYTTDVIEATPNTWDTDWSAFDITVLSSADLALGAAAKTNMPDLDWASTWVAVDGAYPEFQAFHDFKATDNGDGTHTTKCSECALEIGTAAHTYVDGVCACGYVAKCGEVILFWDGSKDSVLADVGETGAADSPIIIDNAAELNYLVTGVAVATTTGKYYKMADGIDKIILQPESIATLDADSNGVYDILETTDIKTYYDETIGVENLANWASADNELWFNGTFDGNNVQFVGMYAKAGSAGLFPTADGGAAFKDLAVVNSYIHGSKNRADGRTNGQCRTGAIVGGTCGAGYGAKVAGTVSFDNIIVANNYLYTERNTVAAAIVMGSENAEEAVAINNAIVYGNNTYCAEAPEVAFTLFNGRGVEGTTTPSVKNSIVLGTTPYNSNSKAAEMFTNVYTDASVDGYAAANIASVAGLTGAELAAACENLDWTGTFLATAGMPTFRAMHDDTFTTVDNGDGTHSVSCSCGLVVESAAHVWENGECTVCDATCDHGEGATVDSVEKTPATCTEAAWYYDQCTVCGISTENMEGGLYQAGDPLGHDPVLVEGTAPTCTETGVKDYYDCSRCDAVFEDEAGATAIDNLDEWKVIAATGHTHATDDENVPVYVVTDAGHQKVCGVCSQLYGEVEAHNGTPVDNGDGTHAMTCTVAGCGYAEESALHVFGDDNVCDTCNWTCESHTYVDDGEPVMLGVDATAEHCKKVAQKCEICGIAGDDRFIAHVAGEWQTSPYAPSAPACAEDGYHTEVLSCTECFYQIASDRKTDPKTGHQFVEHEEEAATCTWEGTIAHKTCDACWGSYAIDAADDEPYENALDPWSGEMSIPVDPEAHVWVEYESTATCEEDGIAAHKFCADCFLFVVDGQETDVVIDWDAFWAYDEETGEPIGIGAKINENYGKIENEAFAAFIAENYPDEGIEVPAYPEDPNDWDAMGAYYDEYYAIWNVLFEIDATWQEAWGEYWMAYQNDVQIAAYYEALLLAAEAAEVDMVAEATGHTLVKVDEVAATYEAEGVKAHYACENCDKLFADENGTEEVTAEELVIAKLVKAEESKPSTDDKTDGDTSDKSPATGESVATVAAVAALMGAAFVLVRKARKA